MLLGLNSLAAAASAAGEALATPAPVPVVPRTVPPAGFTWHDATASSAGYWSRLRVGEVAQGQPIETPPIATPPTAPGDPVPPAPPAPPAPAPVTVDTRTHVGNAADDQAAVDHLKVPTLLWGPGEATDIPKIMKLLTDAGASTGEATWVTRQRQNTLEGAPRFTVRGDSSFLDAADALKAHDRGQTPQQYYAAAWVALAKGNTTAREVAKVEEDKKKALETKPVGGIKPLPPLPRPPTSNRTLIAAVAAIAAGVYLLMGCTRTDTMPSVKKHVLMFPFNTGGTNGARAIGLPGPERYGPALTAVVDSSGNVTLSDRNNGPGVGVPDQLWRQEFRPADQENHEPLVGIGIAPDSPFVSAMIHMSTGSEAELENHVISAGNPLPMTHIPRSIRVSIPTSIPQINVLPTGNVGGIEGASPIGWDATSVPVGSGQVLAWPLRLEAYYGAIPPRSHIRAPLTSRIVLFQEEAVHVPLYFLIDGRKRVTVSVSMTDDEDAVAGGAYNLARNVAVTNFDAPELDEFVEDFGDDLEIIQSRTISAGIPNTTVIDYAVSGGGPVGGPFNPTGDEGHPMGHITLLRVGVISPALDGMITQVSVTASDD